MSGTECDKASKEHRNPPLPLTQFFSPLHTSNDFARNINTDYMKIVNILGGLGNQMFQYALALALEKHFGSEAAVRIDPRAFNGYPLHNGYELKHVFNVKIPEATVREVTRIAYPFLNYRIWQLCRLLPKRKTIRYEWKNIAYDERIFANPHDEYLIGYWQTERYFRSIRESVLQAFTFPPFQPGSNNANLEQELRQLCAVSIHIRRGDYLKISNTSGICTIDYYHKAISKLEELITPDMYVLFSDDIEWCKQQFGAAIGNTRIEFVNWNKGRDSYRDMQLMSLCKHNIIANSSFSWWGAWLNRNPEKIVIAPSRWMHSEGWEEIIPQDWLTIQI